MSALETPDEMAERLFPRPSNREDYRFADRVGAYTGIRARDEQIAAWCEAKAAEAQRKADAHQTASETAMQYDDAESAAAHARSAEHREGQASAFRALAAILRGAT